MRSEPFLIGDWRIEPALNQLRRGDLTRRLTPKAMEVLLVLASRGGEPATREEILDRVWRGVHVQEEILTRAVADLRKAFEDDPKHPRYIATIPKRGYRLLAPITSAGEPSPARAPRGRLPVQPFLSAALLLAALAVLVGSWLRAPVPGAPIVLAPRPLTTLPGREIQPALSPDGARVAFVWQGPAGDNWDIYVKPLREETAARLTRSAAFDLAPAWAPDGRSLAFARYEEVGSCRVMEVDLSRGEERELGSCGRSQNPDLAWSPDGRWLAFSDRESEAESFGIYLLSRDSGERRKLVSPRGQHWGDKDPAFSPDGRFVSFTRSVSMNTQDVYRIRFEGGNPERLTFDAREIRGHAFTPDGRSLVLASARNGRLALWRVPLGGGVPEWLVSTSSGTARSPEIGPRGELVFEDRWFDGDIASVSIQDLAAGRAPVEPVVVSTLEEREPAISPDRQRLLFVSSRSGSPEIWLGDLRGQQARKLTRFEGPHVSAPSWSSDGASAVFDARPQGHADLFRVQLPDGAPERLTSEPSNEIAPSLSLDGRTVYFGSDRAGAWQIWRMPVGDPGAEPEPVTREGGYAPRLSPDGRFLYFTRFDSPGLHRLELGSGSREKLAGTEAMADPSSWVVTGEGILFLCQGEDSVELCRAGGGSEVERLGAIAAEPGGGLGLDLEAGRVYFTRVARSESDLAIAELPSAHPRRGSWVPGTF